MTTILTKTVLVLAIALAFLGLASTQADATHFRYGNIQPRAVSAAPTPTPNVFAVTVKWTINTGWRRSYPGFTTPSNPNVGDTLSSGGAGIIGAFDFGDGTTVNMLPTVTSINVAEDWVYATETLTHTHTCTVNAQGICTITGFFTFSARLSQLLEGNADAPWRVASTIKVNPAGVFASKAPIVTLLPIISVPINSGNVATIQIPAVVFQNDTLTYRFATTAESGLPTPSPTGMTINSATGVITWDLNALPANLRFAGALFATQVIVTDTTGNSVPMDFLLRLSTITGTPPSMLLGNTTATLSTAPLVIDAFTNTEVTFYARGTDADVGASVTVAASNVPVGATFTPSLPSTSNAPTFQNIEFKWTPTEEGTTLILFQAADNTAGIASNMVTIRVTPPNNAPTVTCAPTQTAPVSPNPTVTMTVADADNDPVSVTWFVNDVQVRVDDVPGTNPPVDVLFTQPFAIGTHTVKAVVSDGVAQPVSCTTTLTVEKLAATLTLSNLVHTYDGTPKSATVTTGPVTGLSGVSVTYDGSPTPPTNPGSYSVVAKLTNQNYAAPDATGTLVINQAAAVPSKVTLKPASVIGGVSSKGTVTLTGKAPAGGTSITLGSSTLAASLPSSVTIPAGATSTTFLVSTVPVAVSTPTDISASYGGTTVHATLTVNPAVLSKVALGATSVVGGVSVTTNTVTLTGAAPPAGAQVTLTSSSPTATVPSSLTVPAGATSATFSVTTTPVAASISVTISASGQGVTKTDKLTVKAPAVAVVSLSPSTVQGGNPSTATVTLTGLAPAGGTVVTLKSSKAALAAVPQNVTVLEGTSSADVTVTTTQVTASTAVTISATGGGASKSAKLTVTP